MTTTQWSQAVPSDCCGEPTYSVVKRFTTSRRTRGLGRRIKAQALWLCRVHHESWRTSHPQGPEPYVIKRKEE